MTLEINKSFNKSREKGRLWNEIESVSEEASKKQILKTYLEDQILHLLKLDADDENEIHRGLLEKSLFKIGFDSLMAVDLQFYMERDLNKQISPEALEQEDVSQLVDFVFSTVIVA